jgi:hypothetical protein
LAQTKPTTGTIQAALIVGGIATVAVIAFAVFGRR